MANGTTTERVARRQQGKAEVREEGGEFARFARVVAASFQEIAGSPGVFVADVDGDALWEAYLAAFPEGTNPLFRKRTEHDCSCCRSFVRHAGAVIAISADGGTRTVWGEASVSPSVPMHFRVVAGRLHDILARAGIRDLFRVSERVTGFGAAQTRSYDELASGVVTTWDHFHTGEIPRGLRVALPDTARGDYRTTAQVFERGLIELAPEAVETVLSLVESNAIYRGEEHKQAVAEFRRVQREYLAKVGPGCKPARDLFVWANAGSRVARFRNTVIGTLVQDLSEGKDLEHAVRAFETKVAPQNYKRTTALITPGMVKKAMETIEALGLEPALERRHAHLSDVSVGDVKWVDGAVRPMMKGGIGDALMQHAAASAPVAKVNVHVEDIGLDDFVAKVLPEATGLEVLFRGELAGNLVTLTAPAHPEPRQLFRWTNDFAWSYGGNVADSIRERVKRAGGGVTGTLRVSLSWYNYDDLDLHVYEPQGRGSRGAYDHIFFASRCGWTGGTLDVDMNAGSGTTREPVENVIWPGEVPDGPYRIVVNNYRFRETSDPGFVVEVECDGQVSHFSYNKAVRNQTDVHVCTLHMSGGKVARVEHGDPAVTAGVASQERWGLKTEQYARVSAVTLSPNYWGDNAVGNKHTFFLLEGCRSDEATRGFYNEFLHARLEPHRKVFEVIADKTKCAPSEQQLSGLGFSSTKRETFTVRAQVGKRQRVFNVRVGA